MAAASSVTDWIGAVSTAALGVLGTFVTLWQWRKSGFRPQLSARIDQQGEAIEVLVENTGRAAGIVDQMDVLLPTGVVAAGVICEGFRDGHFKPLALPGLASMRIVIQAAETQNFPAGTQVLVGVGKTEPERVSPNSTPPGVGLFGLTSVLPPAAQPGAGA